MTLNGVMAVLRYIYIHCVMFESYVKLFAARPIVPGTEMRNVVRRI